MTLLRRLRQQVCQRVLQRVEFHWLADDLVRLEGVLGIRSRSFFRIHVGHEYDFRRRGFLTRLDELTELVAVHLRYDGVGDDYVRPVCLRLPQTLHSIE